MNETERLFRNSCNIIYFRSIDYFTVKKPLEKRYWTAALIKKNGGVNDRKKNKERTASRRSQEAFNKPEIERLLFMENAYLKSFERLSFKRRENISERQKAAKYLWIKACFLKVSH